jgi:hypothetical protein
MAAGSALCLRLHNEREHENEKRTKRIRKIKQSTYSDMGTRGFAPGFPELVEGFYDGPSVEPLVGPKLLGAWADEASRVIFAVEAVWPRVLTPDDGALVTSVDVIDLLANEVRGDRARGRGTTNVDGGTIGLVDPLSEGPSRAPLPLAHPPPRWAPRLPSTPRRSTPSDGPLQGPYVRDVRKGSRGVIP